MGTKFFTFSALTAALLVSGCSSTSPGPGPAPQPSPLNYSALALNQGSSSTLEGEGSIGGTVQNVVVTVSDATYRFGGGTVNNAGSYAGIDAYEYSSGGIYDANGAAILDGRNVTAALIADNVNNRGIVVIDGAETSASDLPVQRATYDGLWSISDSRGGQAAGIFDANVDFDRRNIGFNLEDANGIVGGGTGYLQGTGFRADINTVGAEDLNDATRFFNSNNTVDGQFYGPQAAEMAGLVQGTRSDGSATGGLVIGSKR